MEFNVSVQELLKAIGNSNIKSIDDNHSDKMFVKLSNAIILENLLGIIEFSL